MIVCRKLKLLFAHVPKTGGSAVMAALLPYIYKRPVKRIGEHGWQPPLHEIGNMHSPWKDIKSQATKFLDQGFRLAATHRSPYERVASLYHKLGLSRPIEEFVLDRDRRYAWWFQQAVDVAGPMVTDWLDYECLERDLQELLKACGVEEPAPMIQTNVTPNKRPAWKVLTPQAVEIIRERFADDIKMFGYEPPEKP